MLIISTLNNYNIPKIQTFVTSLKESGYKGQKCMIVYKCEESVKTYLKKFGWNIIEKDLEGEDRYIVHKRFQHYAEVINNNYNSNRVTSVSRVLVTDCRDVYFHQNPETLNIVDLYIGQDGHFPQGGPEPSENNNHWAAKEILKEYPDYFEFLKDKFHLNAGVFYGSTDTVVSLCKKVYDLAFESKLYDKNNKLYWKHTAVDQLALNIVAYRDFQYKNEFNNSIINLQQTFWNTDIFFVIYHQYDRIEHFWDKLKEKNKKIF